MYKNLYLTAVLFLFLSVMATGQAQLRNSVYIQGDYKSAFAGKDGSFYLLSRDGRIIVITSDYESIEIPLPTYRDKDMTDAFSDIVSDGKHIMLCGYAYPAIFVLSIKDPTRYGVIPMDTKEGVHSQHPMRMTMRNNTITVRDSAGQNFNVRGKRVVQIAPDLELESGKNAERIKMTIPLNADGTQGDTSVYTESGAFIWKAPLPQDKNRYVSGIDFIGYDKTKDRYLFAVTTTAGELDTEISIYTVKNGQTQAVIPIPYISLPTMTHTLRFSDDGSLYHMTLDMRREDGIIITKLALEQSVKSAG
ncbi:MAG: hypothetical protein GX221_02285 [Candidatus Riflebacteria bacterium]|nr:hypothetical protein [Candidatus Riflebacteria bacterium]